MKKRFALYAMDTHFHHALGNYPLPVRCEMLSETGYDATYLTLWNEQAWEELDQLLEVPGQYNLAVAGVYHMVDLSQPDLTAESRTALSILERLPEDTILELAIRKHSFANSDPQGDEAFLRFLEPLLDSLPPDSRRLSIYPHINFWAETHHDAIRLCRKVDSPVLGMNFNSVHWWAQGASNLPALLQDAAPYLRLANLSGIWRLPGNTNSLGLIVPIDMGHLDPFPVLGAIQQSGFEGFVGFQGYSAGGDVFSYLKRNRNTFRELEDRLQAHPGWVDGFSWKP